MIRVRKHLPPRPISQVAMIPSALLIASGVYFACGLLFSIPFAIVGVKKIDSHAARGSWGFRLLIIPGTTALWPWLLMRWAGGATEPAEERTAHRFAARNTQ